MDEKSHYFNTALSSMAKYAWVTKYDTEYIEKLEDIIGSYAYEPLTKQRAIDLKKECDEFTIGYMKNLLRPAEHAVLVEAVLDERNKFIDDAVVTAEKFANQRNAHGE